MAAAAKHTKAASQARVNFLKILCITGFSLVLVAVDSGQRHASRAVDYESLQRRFVFLRISYAMNESQPIYEFGPFRLSAHKKLLWRDGESVPLAPKVMDTLLVLIEHRDRVVTKDELLERVWGRIVVEEGGLARNISVLRKALGEKPDEHQYLVTVPGQGYRFVADVRETTGAALETSAAVAPRRAWPMRLVLVSVACACVAALVVYLFYGAQPRFPNPLDDAVIKRFTDLEGSELDAAISADGNMIAFLSDRDGGYDVWVGGAAGGDFINLTKGRFARMHMDQLSTVGFNPDGTLVWFRAFERNDAGQDVPNVWVVPVTGGAPRRLLDNTTHLAWSPDGKRMVYQQYTPGDPLFVAAADGSGAQRIFVDEPGRHCHMLAWSPDGRYIYFARGPHPTREMDIWRIRPEGGEPARLTHHNARVGYPTPLAGETLLYTVTTAGSTAASLYAMDLTTLATRRVNTGVEEYPTVSAGAGPTRRKLVATVSNPKGALFTVPIADSVVPESGVQRVALPVAHAVSPRFGPGFILYLSSRHGPHGLEKLADGAVTQLWRGDDGGLIGPPSVTADGSRIAFSIHKDGRNLLYSVRSDGSDLRPLASSLDVLDAGSWSADGKWLAVSGNDATGSRIYKVATDSRSPLPLTEPLSLLPVWSPDGTFLIYSASMNGPGYAVRAVMPDGKTRAMPDLWVPRGGDRYRFRPDGTTVLLLEENGRQNFWLYDARTGSRRQLTDLAQDATIRSFDVSRDGEQIIFDRIRDHADIVLIELRR
jgi:Tol biopolymer transport system component/DNA-binding winged helix-turn-helix (wHTH) protein